MKNDISLFICSVLFSLVASFELYPKDIGVVIGVGDSVTAATHTGKGLHVDSPVLIVIICNRNIHLSLVGIKIRLQS